MNRDRPVACWREYCGRRIDCEDCALLAVPDDAAAGPEVAS
jgi:hypothetical protein